MYLDNCKGLSMSLEQTSFLRIDCFNGEPRMSTNVLCPVSAFFGNYRRAFPGHLSDLTGQTGQFNCKRNAPSFMLVLRISSKQRVPFSECLVFKSSQHRPFNKMIHSIYRLSGLAGQCPLRWCVLFFFLLDFFLDLVALFL